MLKWGRCNSSQQTSFMTELGHMQNGNLGICDSQEQLACGIQGAEAKERDMGTGES